MNPTYNYHGHILEAVESDTVRIYRGGELVDWVSLPGRGLFRTMREAMRLVREEHNAQ